MEIFDPPPLQPKPKKRFRYLYPEGINRGLFAWIYFGSIAFWVLLISAIGSIFVYVLLPFFGVVISSSYQIIFMIGFFAVSVVFGMSMGSKVVNGIILQGVVEGDIIIKK